MRTVLVCYLPSAQIVFQPRRTLSTSSLSPSKSLRVVVGEWQSVSEIRKNSLLRLLLDSFPFILTECATLNRAWNALSGTTARFIVYLSTFYHFPHNCNCKVTKTFISPRIFANTVKYLAFLESCPSHVAKGTSTDIFDISLAPEYLMMDYSVSCAVGCADMSSWQHSLKYSNSNEQWWIMLFLNLEEKNGQTHRVLRQEFLGYLILVLQPGASFRASILGQHWNTPVQGQRKRK